jgi:hypothetical protein
MQSTDIPTMEGQPAPPLSFAAIEARIKAMPEGPLLALETPGWVTFLYAMGAGAAAVGVLPSLFVLIWAPQPWMGAMASGGVIAMCCALALPYVRSLRIMLTALVHFRSSAIEQMDHDRAVMAELSRWLATYPRAAIADHLRSAQYMQATLQAKLGFLGGGADKLGILPAAIAAFIALRNWNDVQATPLWLVIVGLFLCTLWGIGVIASALRLRVQTFEAVLGNAMKLKDGEQAP